jgi:predicted DNA-binding protein with PD1-like motif
MQWTEASLGRVFVIRLEDKERIPEDIEEFAAARGLRAGFVALLGGIAKGKLIVGPEDGQASPVVPLGHVLDGVHEAAALGTIFPDEAGAPRLHMHAALGRDGKSRTGCVRAGIEVWKVIEVVILEIQGADLVRKLDPETGFELLTRV